MKRILVCAALLLTLAPAAGARNGEHKSDPAAQGKPQRPAVTEAPAELIKRTKLTLRTESTMAVSVYLRNPGPEALQQALRTCLSIEEKLPGDMYNGFLLAFCRHESGDAEGETRALSKFRPEQKDLYRYIFYERRDKLAEALTALPAYLCLHLRERPDASDLFPQGSTCPFSGAPVTARHYRSGNRTVAKYMCPDCDGAIRALENRKEGANPLLPVLSLAADTLQDSARFKPGEPDITARLVSAVGLRRGQTVADIGCGYGQFTFAFAEKVGERGKVYAEDIDPAQIELLKHLIGKWKIGNIEPVLGSPTDINIPAGTLDMALLVHVYRRILMDIDEKGDENRDKYLTAFFAGIHKALKRTGTLVVIDHIDPMIGSSGKKLVKILDQRGFKLVSDPYATMDQSFILFFRPAAEGKPRPNKTR